MSALRALPLRLFYSKKENITSRFSKNIKKTLKKLKNIHLLFRRFKMFRFSVDDSTCLVIKLLPDWGINSRTSF